MGHARALVSAGDDDRQINLFKQIIADGLSVRDLEAVVKGVKNGTPVNKTNGSASPKAGNYNFDQQAISYTNRLSEKLNAKVQLSANDSGKGKLVINFNSEEELTEILEKIGE